MKIMSRYNCFLAQQEFRRRMMAPIRCFSTRAACLWPRFSQELRSEKPAEVPRSTIYDTKVCNYHSWLNCLVALEIVKHFYYFFLGYE